VHQEVLADSDFIDGKLSTRFMDRFNRPKTPRDRDSANAAQGASSD
jgi:hypothetical protein